MSKLSPNNSSSDYPAASTVITLGDMKSSPSNTYQVAACKCDLTALLLHTWLSATALVLVIIITRRLMGGLIEPLAFTPAFFVGCAITAYAYAIRLAIRQQGWFGFSPRQIDQKVSLSTAILLLTLMIPGMWSLTAIFLWLPWICIELLWWCVRNETATATNEILTPSVDHNHSQSQEETEDENLLTLTRRVSTDTGEIISGVVKIEFIADQQIAIAHLAFCPPLPHEPNITVELENGEPVTVRVSEARTYGARIEVKRVTSQHQPDRMMLAFEAVAEK